MRRARGDRGAVVVEVALVASLLFTVILGAMAFAIDEAGDSSGTNAAREGARRGIVDYDQADIVGSDAYLAIQGAVRAKLAGLVAGTPAVAVRCYTAAGAQKACTLAGIATGSDQIEVDVTWSRLTSSPFIGNGTKHDVARMTIVGLPPSAAGSGTPGNCLLLPPTITPGLVSQTGGRLDANVTISVAVNSVALCGVPQITTLGPAGESGAAVPISMVPSGSTTFTYMLPSGNADDHWTDGVKDVVVAAGAPGSPQQQASAFVIAPSSACTVTGLAVNPNPIPIKKNGLQKDTTFSVQTSGTCTGLRLGVSGPGWVQPAPSPAPLTGGPTSWSITYAANSGTGTNRASTIDVTIYDAVGPISAPASFTTS